MKYIDIHTHTAINSEIIQIIDFSERGEKEDKQSVYFSVGIHPWHVKQSSIENKIQQLEEQIKHPNFLAIGECGLDKSCAVSFSSQIEAFEKQIELSERYKKPLILHVVKAYNDIVRIRKKTKATQTWIIHGFNGSQQIANEFINLGFYLSFGYLLGNSNSKAARTILVIPNTRLFLETDAQDHRIESIYLLTSKYLNLDISSLIKIIHANFYTVFKVENCLG